MLFVAACYSPHIASGVPCDPAADNCPMGQRCLAIIGGFACGTGESVAIDAPVAAVDGAPDAANDDLDGDGVLNDVDNCPTVYNPDQADEDGDHLGDVCDPCPPSNDNTDTDGDGVADDCDPNPNTPGDKIVMFEGFGNGIPASWAQQGNWNAFGGDVVANDTTGDLVGFGFPDPGFPNETLEAGMVMVAANSSTDAQLVGVVMDYGADGKGAECGALRDDTATPPVPYLQIFETSTAVNLDSNPWAFAIGEDLYLGLTHTDTTYACEGFAFNSGTDATAMGTYTNVEPNPAIGVLAYRAKVRVHWLLVVQSP